MSTKKFIGVIVATLIVFSLGIGVGFYLKKNNNQSLSMSQADKTIPENMSNKDQEVDTPHLIGGQKDNYGCLPAAGYSWCPSQKKCLRAWEEYCEELKDSYQGNDTPSTNHNAPGDTGENPPAESVNWPKYENSAFDFYFQYPPKYKTVIDKYGWPHSVVHLIKSAGGQSYDITVETWDNEAQATSAGRTGSNASYFAMVEHPYTKKLISFTCWNKDTAVDCDGIYNTFGFNQ